MFGKQRPNENGLGEGFVSGVWEDGHGLSLMFQRGLLFFYSIFFSSVSLRIAPLELSKSFGKIHACALIVIKRMSAMATPITRYASRNSPQSMVKECIERRLNRGVILPILCWQQSLSDEQVDFRFAQLDNQAAKPVASALTMSAHALGGGGRSGGLSGLWYRR